MLTDKQKKCYKWTVILSVVLGFLIIVPFRSFFKTEFNRVLECIIKFLLIPAGLAVLSIKTNKQKYVEYERNMRSKVTNMMSYLPVFFYLFGLLINVLHTLTYGYSTGEMYEVLSVGVHSITFIIAAIYLVVGVVILIFIDKIILSLSQEEQKAFDICAMVASIVVILFSFVVTTKYWANLKVETAYGYGDPVLLVVYVAAFILVVITCQIAFKKIDANELLSVCRYGEMETNTPSKTTVKNAYLLACDNILEELVENVSEPESEEIQQEEESQPTEEPQPAEEAQPAEEEIEK